VFRFRRPRTVEGLYNAINAANISVLNDARENPNHFGMGTTVIALDLRWMTKASRRRRCVTSATHGPTNFETVRFVN